MHALKRTFNFIYNHPLAKRHKLLALQKFAHWQITSRLNSGFTIVPFLSDIKVYAKKGLTGITGNIYTGLHEFEDMAFLLHFLREEDVFLDVGANVGSYSLLASGFCKSKTLAFEPVRSTFQILENNMKLNNLSGLLSTHNLGVGKEAGLLYFTCDQDTSNHIVASDDVDIQSVAVNVVSLDQYYPHCKPALLKIDVEGFENEVLEGAKNILDDITLKAIIIELNGCGNRYGFSEEAIHNRLLTLSFNPYQYDPFSRRLTKLNSYGAFNTIYLRDLDFVTARLHSSAGFRIFNEMI